MNKLIKLLILLAIIVSCIASDQASKKIAKEKLGNGMPIIYFNDLFRFHYALNDGAFLSLGSDLTEKLKLWTLKIIPAIFLAGIFVLIIYKLKEFDMMRLISLTLIFSGGSSNIIDRFINNKLVIDFMNMGIGRLRTGVFNFADLFILSGAILLIITYINEKKKIPETTDTDSNA